MADVAAPPYRIIPIIPDLKPGAMEGLQPFVANEKINEAIAAFRESEESQQIFDKWFK